MTETKKEQRKKLFNNIDIYPVISSEFTNGRSPVEVLKNIAQGGAKIVQLREKNMPEKAIQKLAKEYRKITSDYGMLLIINDHTEIALEVDADGVHLGQDDMSLLEAKKVAPELIIGVSTHNKEEAILAQSEGADYINIGPIYSTETKSLSMDALGLNNLTEIIKSIGIPFTVMGGIKTHHIDKLIDKGASKIAMVTEITCAQNVEQRVAELRTLF